MSEKELTHQKIIKQELENSKEELPETLFDPTKLTAPIKEIHVFKNTLFFFSISLLILYFLISKKMNYYLLF